MYKRQDTVNMFVTRIDEELVNHNLLQELRPLDIMSEWIEEGKTTKRFTVAVLLTSDVTSGFTACV